MKDLDPLKQQESNVREERQIPEQKAFRLATTIRVRKGMIIYSFDLSENKLDVVVPEKEVMIGLDEKEVHIKKAKHEKTSVIYIQAINKANAGRKLTKALLELKENGKLSKETSKKIHFI